jgi:hypothetical protein
MILNLKKLSRRIRDVLGEIIDGLLFSLSLVFKRIVFVQVEREKKTGFLFQLLMLYTL